MPTCNLARRCSHAMEHVVTLTSSYCHCSFLISIFIIFRFGSSYRFSANCMACSNNNVHSENVASRVVSPSLIVVPCFSRTSSGVVGYNFNCNFTIFHKVQVLRSPPSLAVYFIVPHCLAIAWSTKTILSPYSHCVESPVYIFNQLPFTLPGKGSPFSFAS